MALESRRAQCDHEAMDCIVSGYDLHASPTRSAIFDAGSVSRANGAHFMNRLLADDEWHGRVPVIYTR
ncbi:MAG: hypothetical protein WD397_07960 [Wenzhouxiangellaceae bacterium]